MIKDIILNVSRSYTPYIAGTKSWGTGDASFAQLDNDLNSIELVKVDDSNWNVITGTTANGYAIKNDGTLWSWGAATNGLLGNNQTTLSSYSPIQLGTRTWVSASAGRFYVVALRSDGTLWSWGDNSYGQLGVGDLLQRSSPVQIGTRTDWTEIYAGGQTAFAKNSTDNALWAWGQTFNAGSSISYFPSKEEPGSFGIVDIETFNWENVQANRSQTMGIKRDKTLWSWGVNINGVLGLSDTVNRSSPVQIGTRLWNNFSIGGSTVNATALAVRDDNTLWAWGANSSGQYGDSSITTRSSPVQVGTLTNWSDVATGFAHTIALKTDGTIWSWGSMQYLGYNNYTIQKVDNTNNWVSASFQIADGGQSIGSVLSLKTDGTMWSWGANNLGQLGQNDNTVRSSPVQIGTRTWKKITNGNGSGYAIRSDDTMWSWGVNQFGTLGNNSSAAPSSPVQIGTRFWKDVKSSAFQSNIFHTLAIRDDDTLWGWGYNVAPQTGIGDGSQTTRSSPVQIGTRTWKKIAVGQNTSFAIRDDDTLWAWGYNFNGMLGTNNASFSNHQSPVQIGTLATWLDVSSRYQNTIAIQTDGTLWTWGYPIGVPENANNLFVRSSPVQIGTETNWASINAGYEAGSAIKTDGTLWTWGRVTVINQQDTGTTFIGLSNGYYQSPVQIGTETNWVSIENAGNGLNLYAINTSNEMYSGPGNTPTTALWGIQPSNSSPVQIGTETNWSKVYAGTSNFAAMKTDGTLWGWGSNANQSSLNIPIVPDVRRVQGLDSPSQIGGYWKKFNTDSRSINITNFSGIKTDDTLWIWGSNQYGQLGLNLGVSDHRSSPVQVGTKLWKDISYGPGYFLAIDSHTNLWSWGQNDDSQYRLGLGQPLLSTNRSSPVQIGTLSGWYNVNAGVTHGTAINANFHVSSSYSLFTAGDSSNVLRPILNRSVEKVNPVPVSEAWYKIQADLNMTIGIKSNKTLWAWGSNDSGQLGINISPYSPVQIGTLLWNDVQTTNRSRTIAIRDDGTLWSWGINDQYQLGDLTNVNRSSPVQVGTKTDWIKASIGHFNSYAIDSSNNLWGWGGTNALGINKKSSTQISPVLIKSDTYFKDVYARYNSDISNFFISTDDKLYTSGKTSENTRRGFDFSIKSPIQIITDRKNWSELSVGTFNAHGIDTTGSLWSWGDVNYLGDENLYGTAAHIKSPVQIGTLTNWAKVYSNDQSTFSIKTDGTLWVWGTNTAIGNLGTNDTISRSSPVQIGTLTDWSFVDPGGYGFLQDYHTIAIKTGGSLFGWGKNAEGAVGDNSNVAKSSPVQIGTLNTWVSASAGYLHSSGIRNDGTLWMWGLNSSGQLGEGSVTSKSSPVQIGTETNWYKVAAGLSYTMALKTDKTLWGWGKSTPGIGRLVNRSNPVAVNIRQSFTNISAGVSFFGITNSGILWSWGLNSFGQLGLEDLTNRSSPVQVGTRTWSDVSSGGSHTMAIRSDNTLWGWGNGGSGQIGHFSTATRQSPVQIGTRADWSKISTGINSTIGIRNDATLWGWGSNIQGDLGLFQFNPIYLTSTDYWNNAKANNQSVILRKNTDNTLWGVGFNVSGQLGLDDTTFRDSPVQIGTRSWNNFSLGASHAMAIGTNGTLWVWGAGGNGQLGIAVDVSIPQPVNTTIKWSSAEVGARYAISINSGSLWGWGINNAGQLGLGDSITRSSPVQIGTETNWSSFDPGNLHTIAIKTDGTLWSWGSNSVGQLGLNLATSANRSSPVQIGTETNWSKVFGSEAATYGIKTDGTLWAWGSNALGKLGLNLATTDHRSSPVQVGTDTNWSTVADIGGNSVSHTMAIKTDGTLWAWGSNSIGQLGLNLATTAHRSSPVQVGTRADWSAVTVGNLHTIARRTDGTIWGWGSNVAGQLGLNLATTAHRSSPVQIGTRTWSDIAAGGSQTMAVRNDGTMWGWGLNTNSQLGDGTNVTKSSPVQIGTLSTWVSASVGEANSMLLINDGTAYATGIYAQGYTTEFTINRSSPLQLGSDTNWSEIDGGNNYSIGIKTDGTIWSWGLNTSGQLGLGNSITRSSPVQIGLLTNWSKIAAGNTHNLALKTDGTIWSWGVNSSGQVGDGTSTNRSSPVQIGTRTWSRIADIKGPTAPSHTMAVRADGTLWGWGAANTGQLGLAKNQTVPNEVFTTVKFTDVKAGNNYGIARSTDGTLWGWSTNSSGQLGLNDLITRSVPVQIGTRTWSNFSTGTTHTTAIRNDGTLWGWGLNTSGQLGDITTTTKSSPVQIGTLADWSYLNAGGTHTTAIKTDGTLWVWGANSSGQLGLNLPVLASSNRSSPVQIGTETNWSKISASGNQYNVAIKTDGTLWSWGNNANGQLGLGDSITRSSPVQIGTETNWSKIADIEGGNTTHALAIKTNGTLWSWGLGSSSQLGLGDSITRSSPVQIGTRTDWLSAVVGDTFSMAISTSGTLWSWGSNSSGQLGVGDTTTRSFPTQVGSLTTWASASLGIQNSILLLNDGTALTTGTGAEGFDASYSINRSSPVQIGTDTNWLSATIGETSTMAIKTNGTLWAWGTNTNSQLGVGDIINRSSPTQVGTLNTWVSASMGANHAVLLSNDSRALTTGVDDKDFRLFNINRSSPVQIGTLSNWSSVITTTSYTMAIKNDGTLWSWGTAASALGISTNTSRLSPVQVGTETNWYSLANPGSINTSVAHAVAIKTDGTLWAWGRGSEGQLGMNSQTSHSSPVQIGTRADWISAAISSGNTIAIRSDRTLWSWGAGTNGLLGTGDTISRSSPVQIGTDLSWVSASISDNGALYLSSLNRAYIAGTTTNAIGFDIDFDVARSSPVQIGNWVEWDDVVTSHAAEWTIAKKSDGSLWAWGENTYGQLAQNDVIVRSSPVLVGNYSDWKKIYAGGRNILGIRDF